MQAFKRPYREEHLTLLYYYGIMPIANIMKMRKLFYFYISMDSRVKIGCFLNDMAQKMLVLSQNGV